MSACWLFVLRLYVLRHTEQLLYFNHRRHVQTSYVYSALYGGIQHSFCTIGRWCLNYKVRRYVTRHQRKLLNSIQRSVIQNSGHPTRHIRTIFDPGDWMTRRGYIMPRWLKASSHQYWPPAWMYIYLSTNVFKNRLDKFWHDQEIIYDSNAQLEGTGSRSAVE